MSKFLLIEDDQILSTFIKQYLTVKKFEVDVVLDGTQGLEWLKQQDYAVAIIDWDLPGIDGKEIIRQYREAGGQTPIIMLTKRSKVADKVTGFEAGADDYLAKPFELDELHARLTSLMRRPPAIKESRITIGTLMVDRHNRVATVRGQQIELSRKEFAILELLTANPEHVFSNDAIMDKVWSTESDGSIWAVRTHIARIRSKIADIDDDPAQLIKTLYGQGYKMELPKS
ncbi:MAG: response regulator transcription factor [Candidatus Obscuribacterales bacterium]|nr:response regulator transcription factor [Candidatus Obscuribacterales bacterium]